MTNIEKQKYMSIPTIGACTTGYGEVFEIKEYIKNNYIVIMFKRANGKCTIHKVKTRVTRGLEGFILGDTHKYICDINWFGR